jgi:hypothetical protein
MLNKTTRKKAIVVNSMVFFLFVSICIAQNIPNAVNFQAIARDGAGALVTNSQIEVQLTILDGGPAGTPLRQPRFIRNTDAYGQFSLTMSEDSATGFGPSGATLIPNIDWSTGNKWVRIEFRPNLISPYTNLGTVKCNSDFYAFSARTAEVLKTPGVAGQVLKHNGTAWVAGADNGAAYTPGNGITITPGNVVRNVPSNSYCYLEEQSTGNSTSSCPSAILYTVYNKRELNTMIDSAGSDIVFNTGSNSVTLNPGTYYVQGMALYYCNVPQGSANGFIFYTHLRLYNLNTASNLLQSIIVRNSGQSGTGPNGNIQANDNLTLNGIIKITGGPQTVELQQTYEAWNAGSFPFSGITAGSNNTYASLFIQKLK